MTHSCLSHFALDRPRAANKGVSIKEGRMGHQRHPDEGPQFSKGLTVARTDWFWDKDMFGSWKKKNAALKKCIRIIC